MTSWSWCRPMFITRLTCQNALSTKAMAFASEAVVHHWFFGVDFAFPLLWWFCDAGLARLLWNALPALILGNVSGSASIYWSLRSGDFQLFTFFWIALVKLLKLCYALLVQDCFYFAPLTLQIRFAWGRFTQALALDSASSTLHAQVVVAVEHEDVVRDLSAFGTWHWFIHRPDI